MNRKLLLLLLTLSYSQLPIGSVAPNFHLLDENKKNHELAFYQGNYVVLYFYPMDFTPGCTAEACNFRDYYSEFTANNIKIIGISWDSPQKHKSFIDKYNLQFSLLSDEGGKISTLYDASGWFFPKRFTYIINPQGVIINVYKNFHIDTHAEDILNFISEHKIESKK
jgi:peroxiredoxin Q/BCP